MTLFISSHGHSHCTRSLRLLVLSSAIALLSGCTLLDKKVFTPEMTLQVEPGSTAGQFTLKGRTNLPQPEVEKRKLPIVITVQAIRQLLPKPDAKTLKNSKPINAIVARQRIESVDGSWDVKLNLLQPSDKGAPLEVWQMHPNQLSADLVPSQTVTFLVATESIDRTLEFSPDVNKTNAAGQKAVLQSAADGSLFLQAEEVRTIAPPSLPKVTAVAPSKPLNVPAQTMSGKSPTKQNNAPIQAQEFLR